MNGSLTLANRYLSLKVVKEIKVIDFKITDWEEVFLVQIYVVLCMYGAY